MFYNVLNILLQEVLTMKVVRVCESRPPRIATKDTLSLSSEPQARSLYRPRTHRMEESTGLWAKGMSSAYIGVKEVRGQVPGTTRNYSTTSRPQVT